MTGSVATAADATTAAELLEHLVEKRYGSSVLLLPVRVEEDDGGWSARLHLSWAGRTSTFVVGLLGRSLITQDHDAESASSIAFAAVMEHLEAIR